MKMRFPFFAVAAASVFAASCTADKDLYNENYKNEVVEATYDQQFEKVFGKVNPNQDFNMAKEYTLSVSGAVNGVKVYAPSTAGVYSLVASYENAPQSITYTAVEGTEAVIVMDGTGKIQKIAPNGKASFNSTRVVVPSSKEGKPSIEAIKLQQNLAFTSSDNPKGKAFKLLGTKKFPVYYTHANNRNDNKPTVQEFGIWYIDASGERQEVPTWKANTGNNGEEFNSTTPGFMVDFGPTGLFKGDTNPEFPETIEFGFYAWDGNQKVYSTDSKTIQQGKKKYVEYYRAVTNEVADPNNPDKDYYVIRFDLGTVNASNNHNDLFLIIPYQYIEIVTPDEFAWALAVEDLGTTDDFDFNDIVFSASHVSGKTEMNVTALAAGGILPAEIYFGEKRVGEIHDMLDVATDKITNTSNTVKLVAGQTKTVPVPDGFKLSEAMANFKVHVDPNGTSEKWVEFPKSGQTPKMICVPANWRWPVERTRVDEAYPLFKNWVTENPYSVDITKSWWYTEPAAGTTVIR